MTQNRQSNLKFHMDYGECGINTGKMTAVFTAAGMTGRCAGRCEGAIPRRETGSGTRYRGGCDPSPGCGTYLGSDAPKMENWKCVQPPWQRERGDRLTLKGDGVK